MLDILTRLKLEIRKGEVMEETREDRLNRLYIELGELEAEYHYIMRDNGKGNIDILMHKLKVLRDQIAELEDGE